MNIRYFEMSNGTKWLGGGIDLTPHYIVDEDATFFHSQVKNVCDKHHSSYYSKFKNYPHGHSHLISGKFTIPLHNQIINLFS